MRILFYHKFYNSQRLDNMSLNTISVLFNHKFFPSGESIGNTEKHTLCLKEHITLASNKFTLKLF